MLPEIREHSLIENLFTILLANMYVDLLISQKMEIKQNTKEKKINFV